MESPSGALFYNSMTNCKKAGIVIEHDETSLEAFRGVVVPLADDERGKYFLNIYMDERRLSIVVFSLFFSWILAFPFEGQALYALAQQYNIDPSTMIFQSIIAHFVGLFLCGFVVKTMKAAKRLMLSSIVFCIMGSSVFLFAPSILWNIALISSSFMAGTSLSAWGFYFKSGTPSNERIKIAADALIYSNILMILMNMTAIHLSPYAGLVLSILMLGGALFFTIQLPVNTQPLLYPLSEKLEMEISTFKPFVFLCLFIIIITINSGLMYQVINPAFAHIEWLVSWYWAVPYIIALYIMKNLQRTTSRTYILYVAIAMIGLAFIAFMTLDRSATSYLVVNTLMLGACGIFDLFWWSILGEMLDLDKNPAKILGIGLSANVFGVMLGGFIGNQILTLDNQNLNPSVLALVVVFIILILFPLLHKQLSILLKDHAFLTILSEVSAAEQTKVISSFTKIGRLTERESEIATLLLKGRTYKMIAEELYLSQNTIKTHIKNIYSKFNIQSRMELVNLIMEKDRSLLK